MNHTRGLAIVALCLCACDDVRPIRPGATPDLGGALTCVQLNDCERQCEDSACVDACRAQGTSQARTLEGALVDCFNRYCPQSSENGPELCAPPFSDA